MIQSKDYDGVLCTLVHLGTGQPMVKGDRVILHGSPTELDWFITGGRAPHTENSTGKVYVQHKRTAAQREFYPSVIDCEWRVA